MNAISLEYEFSRYPVLIFLILSTLIFIALRGIKFTLPRLVKKYPDTEMITRHFHSFELVVWLIYLLMLLPWFYSRNIYYAAGLSVIIALILLYLGWFAIKDIVAGMMLRNNPSIKVGNKLIINDNNITINKLTATYVEGRLENGDLFFIRYSNLIKENFSRIIENELTYNKTIEIKVKDDGNSDKFITNIRSFLISRPGYAVKHSPEILKTSTDKEITTYKITFYSLDYENIINIEQELRKKFENGK
jgi:hypothetical protein